MSTIKFRGKRLDNGEWVYGYFIKLSNGECHIFSPMEDTTLGEFYNWKVDPATVGQYTGLTDHNGKEIYEGDVVLQQAYSGKEPMLVRFEHGAFVTGEHSGSSTAIRPMLIQKRCEVLGNIYDNPGLISKKQ